MAINSMNIVVNSGLFLGTTSSQKTKQPSTLHQVDGDVSSWRIVSLILEPKRRPGRRFCLVMVIITIAVIN
jgi:hypothetical protein